MNKSRHTQAFRSQRKSKGNRSNQKEKNPSQTAEKLPVVVYLRISDEEEAISIPYNLWVDPIKKFIKETGATWCPVFKIWKLDRAKMEYVKRDFPKILTADYQFPPTFIDLVSLPLGDITINQFKYKKKQYQLETHPLYHKLYPFQRETLQFCLNHHGRILIADEMGVGKSIQALSCCYLYPQHFPVLIICPSSLKYVWKDEIGKWFKNSINPSQVFIIKKGVLKKGQLKNSKFIIGSYEICAKLSQQLEYIKMVICDEAHFLKNPDTQRCEQLNHFLSVTKRIFMLSGTPMLAKPKQIFNILRILRPDIFKSLQSFGNRYCQRRKNPWTSKWEFNDAKNLAELHYILTKIIMIHRLKADVLPQLPPKQRQIIFMETQKTVISEIKQLMGCTISIQNIRNSQKLLGVFSNGSSNRQNESMMRCYLLSAMAKLQSVKHYIGALLQNDVKIIIFAHHKTIMDQLQAHLKGLHIQYIRLDGQVSPQTRKKKVDIFQDQFDIRVALLSITALGTGFTLTAASTVVFAELHWTPAILMQAEDRTHRIGQKNSVNIHYLIGDQTLDPLMLRQLQKKIDIVAKVIDGSADTLNMDVVPKGQMGCFEINNQEQNKDRQKKITDYFSVLKKQPFQIKQQQIQINDQNENRQQKTNMKLAKSEKIKRLFESSQQQDSLVQQFMRKKKNIINQSQPSQNQQMAQ